MAIQELQPCIATLKPGLTYLALKLTSCFLVFFSKADWNVCIGKQTLSMRRYKQTRNRRFFANLKFEKGKLPFLDVNLFLHWRGIFQAHSNIFIQINYIFNLKIMLFSAWWVEALKCIMCRKGSNIDFLVTSPICLNPSHSVIK